MLSYRKLFFISFVLLFAGSVAFSASLAFKLSINGKSFTDVKTINGQTYVHLSKFASQANLSVKTNSKNKTIEVASKPIPTAEIIYITLPTPEPKIITITQPSPTPRIVYMMATVAPKTADAPTATPSPKPTAVPKPTPKTMITQADLPYRFDADNDMSFVINSYSATTNGIQMNITLENRSDVLDKGKIMTSTWELYDGKNTLKHLSQDDVFYEMYLRSKQSITGNIYFKGLSYPADSFILYGSLWQYIDAVNFKLTFQVN